jgi:HlyD family secretion protein
LERARSLFEEGLGNSIDYEKAKDEVSVAQLELDHARQKLTLDKETLDFELRTKELEIDRQHLIEANLKRQVNELAVISPVNGLVANIEIQDKDTVQPNQKLFSVVDLSEFEIEILIPENYADEVDTGTEVRIRYEGSEFLGEVKSLSPEVLESQVKGIVAFTQDPPPGLKQNQRVDARLILDSRLDVIKIPRGPFLESLGGRKAYVVEDGLAVLRPIEIGSISVTEIEVRSGLAEGDVVILTDLVRFDGVETILLRQ